MYFLHDIIWSDFSDEETADQDQIDGIQLNDAKESETREWEELSDEESDVEKPVQSASTETLNSEDFIPVAQCRRTILKPKRYCHEAFETYLIQQHTRITIKHQRKLIWSSWSSNRREITPIKFEEVMSWPDRKTGWDQSKRVSVNCPRQFTNDNRYIKA